MSRSTRWDDEDKHLRTTFAGLMAGVAIASVLVLVGGVVIRMTEGSSFAQAISSIDAVGSAASAVVCTVIYLAARRHARG